MNGDDLYEYIEFALQEARLFPERLRALYAEYRVNALTHPNEPVWKQACVRANELIERCESSRKIGTAFADHELPLRKE